MVARWTAVLMVALSMSACDMRPIGGHWYTTYHSHFPESGGDLTLYRKGFLGIPTKVDSRVYVLRAYPNDCIVYEPEQRARGWLYAACGAQTPARLVYAAPWAEDKDQWSANDGGLELIESMSVQNGKAVAHVQRVPLAEIVRVATTSNAQVQVDQTIEPVDVNSRDEIGGTPLMRAVREGQMDVVAALLRAGADPNAADRYNITALGLAANTLNPDTGIAHLLLFHGADPCARDNTGKTIIDRVPSSDWRLRRMLIAHGRCS